MSLNPSSRVDLYAHADAHALVDRLRGTAPLDGVDAMEAAGYAMAEAADLIEAIVTSVTEPALRSGTMKRPHPEPATRDTHDRVRANLRRLRRERGWNQAEMSERLGLTGYAVSSQVISKIERGSRTPHAADLEAFAEVLGVSVMDVLATSLKETHRR